MIHVKSQPQQGFTIIELMLSMSFIALLMLAIAMTTIQIGSIYNKGITLREVNQAGRAVSADLQRSIATAVPFDVTPRTGAPTDSPTSKYVTRPDGGRLCVGDYTYAWTYGKNIASPSLNKYTTGGAVRFAKIPDAGGALCAGTPGAINPANVSELLSSGDRDLVVHNVTIKQGASDPTTGQTLYALSLIIGTSDTSQLTPDDASCKPPATLQGASNYCSVNQFDIIARAGNTVK